ncbi:MULTISPECIES: hypothetical protein [Paenibacillus]|uniref:hypothetical protein n=1 Tax=Paenibacillus TaxID=44249 RepID=UPI002FE2130A
MKTKLLKGCLAVLLLTGGIGATITVHPAEAKADAAGVINKLPEPQWSQPDVVGESGGVEEEPFEVPKLNTVYLHTKEEHLTQTKVWVVDTLKAFDTGTGKLKWSANFADPGTSMVREAQPFLVSPDGTVYVTFTDNLSPAGTQVYAVGPDGKRKWTLNFSSKDGYLFRLADGNLVFASRGKMDTLGNYTGGSLTLIDKNGTRLKSLAYKGNVIVKGSRVLLQTNYGGGKGSRIEALDAALKRVFVHQLPAQSYAEVGFDQVLADGTVLVRANLPKTGNRLFGFSPTGKLLWGRDIAGNAEVASLGNVYGVYANGKLSLFNAKGLVKSAAIPAQTVYFITLDLLQDGTVELNLTGSGRYVLDPVTLQAKYTIRVPEDDHFTYAGNGAGYVVTGKGFSRYKF